jgi:hypothetical protein
MSTIHDDTPHPIPPTAYLRYKKNWFFILMDVDNGVFGMAHFNHEPGHDRARFSCNLMVGGELFKYANQTTFPPNFAFSSRIGDDKLQVTFVEPYTRIDRSGSRVERLAAAGRADRRTHRQSSGTSRPGRARPRECLARDRYAGRPAG